jgi:uncharacterized protein (DUF2141 family)
MARSILKSRFTKPTPAAQQQGYCTLLLRFTHLRSTKGVVRAALFNGSLGFPDDLSNAFRLFTLPIAPNCIAQQTIPDLPYGKYALSYFHDEQNRQRLDRNLLGQPVQDYGFSNDARGFFAAPPFSEAAFDLREPFVELKYRVYRRKRLLDM